GEYDILQHMAKIPAQITLRELLRRSPSHQEAMFKFLQGINVSEDLPPASLVQAIMSLCVTPSIVFYNEEWAPKECRSLPLCILIFLNGIVVESALLDSRASINVCPIRTFEKLEIREEDLQRTNTQISAYDNSKQAARGAIKLHLQLRAADM